MKVGDRVSFRLKFTGVEWNIACGLGPDADGVIDIVISKTRFLDFFHAEISCELMDHSGHHL